MRSICKTDLNDYSSRSHAILKIHIEKRKRISSTKVASYVGDIHLIDLAGSEDITLSNVKD